MTGKQLALLVAIAFVLTIYNVIPGVVFWLILVVCGGLAINNGSDEHAGDSWD